MSMILILNRDFTFNFFRALASHRLHSRTSENVFLISIMSGSPCIFLKDSTECPCIVSGPFDEVKYVNHRSLGVQFFAYRMPMYEILNFDHFMRYANGVRS